MESQNTDLDRIDFGILRLLMRDASLSNKQIAAHVGLAPSSSHERLKALKARGVLLGSHAQVDLRALGLALEALLFVQLAKLEHAQVDDLVQQTAAVNEVRCVFLVSGRFDLIVHVVIQDMDHLKRLISDHFNVHPCVVRVETSMVFDRKSQFRMPIAEL